MASISKGGDKKPSGTNRSAAVTDGEGSADRLAVEPDSRQGRDPGPGSERGVTAEEVMSTEVVVAEPDTSASDAARLMRDNDIGFLPVCQRDGTVLGVLTDRDLVIRVLADELPSGTRVEEIMTEDVATCHAGDDLAVCERLMRANQVTRMIVLGDDDQLVGIVSLADLANNDEDDQRLGDLVADVKVSDLGR
jgi:CBS domain-containing protein